MYVEHTLDPVYFSDSKVLILGSHPSIKSREVCFYYANPQNKFWKVLEIAYEERIGNTVEERIDFLKKHNIALFDVIKSCYIVGSSDSSIRDVVPNDISEILKNSEIKAIYTHGDKAFKLYNKFIYPVVGIPAIKLPSTSPAYCRKGVLEELVNEYKKIRKLTH